MRFTLSAAAFTIVALHPLTSHAQLGDAGAAGAISGDAGAAGAAGSGNDAAGEAGASEAQGGKAGSGGATSSAGKGGGGGSAPVPAPNLPDPGTDQSNSCSLAGPHTPFNLFGTALVLGAACLTLRRRRSR